MPFKLVLPALLALAALAAAVASGLQFTLASGLLPAALAVLGHVLALLPVSVHGSLLPVSSGKLKDYPEWPVPVMALIPWALLTFVTQDWRVSVVGFAHIAAITCGYSAVRLIRGLHQKAFSNVCTSPDITEVSTPDLSARTAYMIRAFVAVSALVSYFAILLGADPMAWSILFNAIAVLILVVILYSSWSSTKAAAKLAATTRKSLLNNCLRDRSVQVAVYHAGTSRSQIDATTALLEHLEELGLPCVLIVREERAFIALRRAPATHRWHAKTMTSLDHCVHQDIRSVLYACDVPQNSHFTRYAQFNHTLVTAFSSLASQPILTNNLALYDRILAPDMATADQWRATSPDDIKSRVSVILEGYSALPSHVSTQTALSFFWHSALLNDDLAVEEISTYLTRMIEATCTAKSMHLKIWFPDTFAPNAQRLHAARHRLQKAAYAVDPNSETISIHAGSEADSANSADLVICTRSSNIDALMSAGKPLVTMSTGYSSADDLPELAPTEASIANAMATALSGAPKQPPRRHFLSFEALCATLPETPDLRAVA